MNEVMQALLSVDDAITHVQKLKRDDFTKDILRELGKIKERLEWRLGKLENDRLQALRDITEK